MAHTYKATKLPDGRIHIRIPKEIAYRGIGQIEVLLHTALFECQIDRARELDTFYSGDAAEYNVVGWPIDWSKVEPPEFTPPRPPPIVIPAPQVHVHVDRPRGIGWFR